MWYFSNYVSVINCCRLVTDIPGTAGATHGKSYNINSMIMISHLAYMISLFFHPFFSFRPRGSVVWEPTTFPRHPPVCFCSISTARKPDYLCTGMASELLHAGFCGAVQFGASCSCSFFQLPTRVRFRWKKNASVKLLNVHGIVPFLS